MKKRYRDRKLSRWALNGITGASSLSIYIYIYIFKILFIYFCVCWVFVAALGGYSSLQCKGFSLWWLFLLQTMCSRARRAQYLWHTGGMWNLPRQEKTESSQTCVPCSDWGIPNHSFTREVCKLQFLKVHRCLFKKEAEGDFSGSPVGKTLHSQRGPGFDP